MDRLSYSLNNDNLTFSTQCVNCVVPLVIRGINDEEGIRLVEQCGCINGEPIITVYETDAEMRAAFETNTAALIAEIQIDAATAAENRTTVVVRDPNGRVRSVPWNDQLPNRGMVAVLMEAAGDDVLNGEQLTPEQLVGHYAPIDLARVICSRANQARAALVEPTVVLNGNRG